MQKILFWMKKIVKGNGRYCKCFCPTCPYYEQCKNDGEDYYFAQDSIVRAVTELGIMSEESARSWADNAEKSYSLSIEKFAGYVKKYCDKKGKNHHILFLVDEIGQYIADDSKLMLNLQTVTEDLGTACSGKAWIIVTSQ